MIQASPPYRPRRCECVMKNRIGERLIRPIGIRTGQYLPWPWTAIVVALGWLCFTAPTAAAQQAAGRDIDEQEIERQLKTLAKEDRFEEATDLASRALGQAEQQEGAASLAAARWHLWLGRLQAATLRPAGAEGFGAADRLKRAESHLEKAITITRKEAPKGVLAAEAVDEMGSLRCLQRRYGEGLPLFEKGLEIREKFFEDKNSLELIPSLESIARCYRLMGDIAAAVAPLERALAIRERRLGPEHRSTAISLRNLGDLRRAQLEFAAARPLLEKSLEIRERVLGPDDPLTGETLHDLGALFHDQGRNDEAEKYYRRSLSIRLKSLGADCPETLSTVSSLARLYREDKRDEAAERLLADPAAFVAL